MILPALDGNGIFHALLTNSLQVGSIDEILLAPTEEANSIKPYITFCTTNNRPISGGYFEDEIITYFVDKNSSRVFHTE